MLTRDHPLLRNRYSLITPDIQGLAERLRLIVSASVYGILVVGHTRFGKTWAIRYIVDCLPEILGMPCFATKVQWSKPDGKVSARAFYERLLRAVNRPVQGTAGVLEDRLIEALYCLNTEIGSNHCCLFVDEAQHVTPNEFSWFCSVFNALQERDIELFVISVGQPQLLEGKSLLESRLDSQVIGRFMRDDYRFSGIQSSQQLGDLLKQYDESLIYPTAAETSFTESALPLAFGAGWRLFGHRDRLWANYTQTREDRGLSVDLGMSMMSCHSLVSLLLQELHSNDVEDLVLKDEIVSSVVDYVVKHHV